MFKAMRMLFKIKVAYTTNKIIFALRKIPGINLLVTQGWYGEENIKLVMTIVSIIRGIIGMLFRKFMYFGGIYLIAAKVAPDLLKGFDGGELFLYLVLGLSLLGGYYNNFANNAEPEDYYAVILLRMNPKNYTLASLVFDAVELIFGNMVIMGIFGAFLAIPFLMTTIVSFGIVGVKLVFAHYILFIFSRKGQIPEIKMPGIIATLILFAAYLGLPFLGVHIPNIIEGGIFALAIILGIISAIYFLRYKKFTQFQKQHLSKVPDMGNEVSKAVRESSDKAIIDDAGIRSDEEGLAFLNDIFIKRHRKILWKPILIMSGLSAAMVIASVIGSLIYPFVAEALRRLLSGYMSVFVMVAYVMNRGTNFTHSLFYNCDHSLLRYPMYRRKAVMMRLFKIRLISISKLNLIPMTILGVGVFILNYILFGQSNLISGMVLLLMLPCCSIIFSVHYLMLYYVIQPFMESAKVLNFKYTLILSFTYFPCYLLINKEFSSFEFGITVIVTTVLYTIISLLLVRKFAPKHFIYRD